MARPSTPPVLSDLQNACSSAAQVKALRQIKNELIGHELRKRYWIGCGILHPLVGILKSYRDGKRRTQTGAPPESVDHGDSAQVQAIIILGCLAQGGLDPSSPPNHPLTVLIPRGPRICPPNIRKLRATFAARSSVSRRFLTINHHSIAANTQLLCQRLEPLLH